MLVNRQKYWYFGSCQKCYKNDDIRLQEDPPTGVSGAPTDNNIMIWNAVIFGYLMLYTYFKVTIF